MTTTARSLPDELCATTLDAAVSGAGLREVHGPGGGPSLPLTAAQGGGDVGRMRIFAGDGVVAKAVHVSLVVPPIGLDSHMVFAFTRHESRIPHFTLDSVFGQGSLAFHLDLIPRVDIAADLAYVDRVYEPLTAMFEDVRTWEGLTRANLSPRQIAMMSPWMLVNRATPDVFSRMHEPVAAYRDHWLSLVAAGEEPVAADEAARLRDRDLRHRAALFSPEVDPVWNVVARLLGEEQRERVRTQLLTNDVEGA